MALTIPNIIAGGIPIGIAPAQTWLTGIKRKDAVSLGFRDKAGVLRHTNLELDGPVSVTATFNTDMLGAVENAVDLSDAEWVEFGIVILFKDYTPAGAAVTSNCKEVGRFYFDMAAHGGPRSVGIPSPRDGLVVPGGKNEIDRTHPDVINFVNEFTGLGLTTRTFLIDNDYPTNFVGGRRVTHK